MPLLLRPLSQASAVLPLSSILPISPFLLPFLNTQHRNASILSSLSDNPGAYQKRIRLGRGPASGKGKTSGRGHKGQKQHGKVPRGFNGGQTKTEVVRGLDNDRAFAKDLVPLNLDRLQSWIDQGRIDPKRPITVKELGKSRCATNIKDGIKLLARGATQIRFPLNIIVSRASGSAIAAIEAAGGTITTRYYTRFAIRRILRGTTDPANSLLTRNRIPVVMVHGKRTRRGGGQGGFLHRLPDPTSRKDIEYYRDPAHRGYLSYQVQEDEGPSLFHKPPRRPTAPSKEAVEEGQRKTAAAENRLW